MRATPASYPEPGATMTADYLHGLVDNTTLNEFEVAELTNIGGGLSSGDDPTTEAAMRQTTDYEVYRDPVSTISLASFGTRQLTGKIDLAYYKNTEGWQPTNGNVCYYPGHADNAREHWSGWTCYPGSGMWQVPRISVDMKLWNQFNGWLFPSTTYSEVTYPGQVWGVVEEGGTGDGLVKVCQYGFCDAFVSAEFSTELTLPNSVFGVLYSHAAKTFVPASMGYATDPGYTVNIHPLGLVRRVYTDSGITSIPFVIEADSPGNTSMDVYMAKIFLGGGTPCL